MTKLSPRAQEKRAQILRGARQAFMDGGFAATSTDAVVKQAGVSKQTLYVYFRTKDELLVAVLEELLEALPERGLPEITDGTTPDAAWVRRAALELARAFVRLTMQPDYIALMRILVAESGTRPELADQFRARMPAGVIAAINRILEVAVDADVVHERVLEQRGVAARGLLGPLVTYPVIDGLLSPGEDARPPDDEVLELIVDRWLAGLEVRDQTV
ncbi:TetR/AcrR family transcriptional regulator [Euzebya tangerina]|uniref:TetR/AcrR family transcriptional regulator n=1 Tax=Euzebya tangerina TaxID=591198 RepID=UPI000E318A0D|nr:TetR/AcrR family transcriptional regulator [Euzebya tangerina]